MPKRARTFKPKFRDLNLGAIEQLAETDDYMLAGTSFNPKSQTLVVLFRRVGTDNIGELVIASGPPGAYRVGVLYDRRFNYVVGICIVGVVDWIVNTNESDKKWTFISSAWTTQAIKFWRGLFGR